MVTGDRTALRTCPLCEATCGLEVVIRDREVVSVRGDREDVFSHGYVCPKAVGLAALERDPDRLRTPLVRRDGRLAPATWEQAYEEIDDRLGRVLSEHGRDALAVYLGNPNAHSIAGAFYVSTLVRAAGTRNVYSASTLDQMPKHVSAGLIFGHPLTIPVPDLDRTDHLLMLGANPLESNGSLMTAPDMRGRLRRLRERGGRLVVVDPRRSRTAEEADEHVPIRPGTDAHLLAAMAHSLFAEGLVSLGRLAEHVDGVDAVRAALEPFSPEAVASVCRVEASTVRRLARDLAAAPRAAVYGRIGTSTQEFGTLASWLVDVLNVLTGNLDAEGGAMFTRAAVGARNTLGVPGRGRGFTTGRWRSRVRGLPEVLGELPSACLAEEIDTPGDGRVRALLTVAGNPVLSHPNGCRLERALAGLDVLVSVDLYVNETTRHADVVLPVPSALSRAHYDVLLYQLAVRDTAHYSPPALPLQPGEQDEWEILLRLAAILAGQGTRVDVDVLDDAVAAQEVERAVALRGSRVEGADPAALLARLGPRHGPERLLDLQLRIGPYGDAFGADPAGLTFEQLAAQPHGIDLGPLEPRLPEVLRTVSGKVELAAAPLITDLERLRGSLSGLAGGLVLVGRRHLRSNNSWMHNVDFLVRGPERCTLQVHPDDAVELGIVDGGRARVASRVGSLEIGVEVTDAIMPGVVSIPHGWGHSGTAMRVAAAHPGVNANLLVDEQQVEPLSGNAVLNGVPVTVEPVEAASPRPLGSDEVALPAEK
jgi:anaerobic selenocysteine-containing dehydrogenase